MATQSILKSVNIKSNRRCLSLVRALEQSKSKGPNKVVLTKEVRDLTPEQIRAIFKKEK